MYLSLNWLKDFVKIPRRVTPEELASKLTYHTVEVEKTENQAEKYRNVVVGKILEVKKHPNADRLQLARVDIGSQILKIVCGAPNIEAGQLVPVALSGAILPNGAEIKEAEVRGEKSQGMLCATDELGLGEDHTGILILDKRAKVGETLSKYLKLDDVIFEVDNKSLTNRPDLWSHIGMAREISAFLNTAFIQPKFDKKIFSKIDGGALNIKISVPELCPRYLAVALQGVEINSSPGWLQNRLIAAGLRPINNIVDITNYVMLELGQPLHAFDRELVDKINVRLSRPGEVLEMLDGQKRELDSQILVIADSQKPIAVAGVMGGANSEIGDKTKSIIIESANFDFISIRKTSNKLGLRTESSMRFEKGLDQELAEAGIIRAIELIKKICPNAKLASQLFDSRTKPLALKQINLDLDWLAEVLGERIKEGQITQILVSLGFSVKENQKDKVLMVTVPSWRATRDISLPEDLAEEVARIYGFNNIKSRLPEITMGVAERQPELILIKEIKKMLTSGPALTEVYNYSFVGDEQLKKIFIDPATHIKLVNPIASHQTLLRQSLIPNLLENIKTNQARFTEINLFEIGSIYLPAESEFNKDNRGGGQLPYQEKRLGIIMADEGKTDLFRKVKGVVECLLINFNLSASWRASEIKASWSDQGVAAEIMAAGMMIGNAGLIDGQLARGLGLKKKIAVAEINIGQLLKVIEQTPPKLYQEYEKFPPAIRDLAFVVGAKILYNDVKSEIENFSQLIKRVELFDVYEGGKLGPKNKSLAFHIVFQADRTLTSEEVDGLQQGLIKKLADKFGTKVRDF